MKRKMFFKRYKRKNLSSTLWKGRQREARTERRSSGKMSRMEAKRQPLGKPNFYKIIMPSVIRENRLVLPRDFVERYKAQLSKTATLDLPAGPSWSIGLKKYAHLLFLDDGWEKFMKHLSIRLGYFLFFQFKGNSRFDLNIFDLSGIEIQYPLGSPFKRSKHANENAAPGKQSPHDAEVKEEEKDESLSDYLGATCKIRSSKQNATSKQATLGSSPSLNQTSTSKNNKRQLGKEPAVEQEVEMTLGATVMSKTENPFFIAKMKKYNLSGSYLLNLPADFGREIVTEKGRFIQIQDPNENKWQARCIISKGRVRGIGTGWKMFAQEKRLQIDDECVFELIQSSIMKVSVSCPSKKGSES